MPGLFRLSKSGLSFAFGKEDSYERNPSGVSFVFNYRIFRTFIKVLKMLVSLSKKGAAFFDRLKRREAFASRRFLLIRMAGVLRAA